MVLLSDLLTRTVPLEGECWNIRSDVLVFDSCCPRGTYFIYTPTYSRILKCRVCNPLHLPSGIIRAHAIKFLQHIPLAAPRLTHIAQHSPCTACQVRRRNHIRLPRRIERAADCGIDSPICRNNEPCASRPSQRTRIR